MNAPEPLSSDALATLGHAADIARQRADFCYAKHQQMLGDIAALQAAAAAVLRHGQAMAAAADAFEDQTVLSHHLGTVSIAVPTGDAPNVQPR